MPTIFTRIINGEIPGAFVLQAERWVAFLDIAPVSPGHVLLVPRAEHALLAELPADTLADLGPLLARIDAAIRTVTGCAAVSILLRDGETAGQEVPHVHWHLVPRHAGDQPHGFRGGVYASDDAREQIRTALTTELGTAPGEA